MTCYTPLKAWRTSENTSNGKKKIAFKQSETTTTQLQLPCGTCIGCKLDRSLSWAIRCVHESQMHTQNSFITLTYSPEHLPWDGSLVKSHISKFIRALRKKQKSKTIRYFMCGEYGEKLSRPHYHICLFGYNFPDREIYENNEGILTYTSEILENIWGRGFCTIGELNFDTAAYTARYILKKINGERQKEHYIKTDSITGEILELEPEFTTMSRRPGIAAGWYEKYKSDIFPSDNLIHRNHSVKIPRYYDNILEKEDPLQLEEQKRKRKIQAGKSLEDNTPERLAVREKSKQLKLKQLTRSYENDTQNLRGIR